MSTELFNNTDTNNQTISNNSFSGGIIRGQCFQMNQTNENGNQFIQLTRSQVLQQISIMEMWLDNQSQ